MVTARQCFSGISFFSSFLLLSAMTLMSVRCPSSRRSAELAESLWEVQTPLLLRDPLEQRPKQNACAAVQLPPTLTGG